MSKYRVNFRKIAEEHLPFALRTDSVMAFVLALLSGLLRVRYLFNIHSQDLNRRLSYNSQIANLQRLLNDNFDTNRQIEVLDADYYEVKFHVVQTDYTTDEVIGGELYHVITPPRVPFYAEAEDVYALQDDDVILSAVDIGEPAQYNWYDMEGNLVCQEIDFQTIASENHTYKLEVIALADGYKDYADVKIEIIQNPNKIASIYPNPAGSADDVTIDCVLSTIASAQIVISDYFGRVFGDFSITNTAPSVDFNVRGYPIGTYVVKLVSCGQIIDTKTFVKQ